MTLDASGVTLEGNYIGVQSNGITTAGNRGDGVRISASSHGDLIGRSDPVTGVSYYNTANVSMQPVSGWQGIRGAATPGQYLISGTSNSNGILFVGAINGQGTSYSVNYPAAATTSVYGPDNLNNGGIRLVGSYKNADASTSPVEVNGFLFEGTTADLPSGGSYRTIDYPGAKFNYVHSTMGGLAVGNYDGPTQSGQAIGPGQAYIYDVATSTFLTNIVFPGSVSDSAYGIWSNGGTKYTICGGFSNLSVNNLDDQGRPIGQAFLVDYDLATGQFSNWKAFNYPNGLIGQTYVTHFEGISSVEQGVYTLSRRLGANGVEQSDARFVGLGATQYRRDVRRRRVGQFELPRHAGHHELELGVRQPSRGDRDRSGGLTILPGDGQHGIPTVERHQRQSWQRHRNLRE